MVRHPRADLLAGLVVALALIPEAIGLSIIAGVGPAIGLYASVSIAVVIAPRLTLVAVIIVVSIGTLSKRSVRGLRRTPWPSSTITPART